MILIEYLIVIDDRHDVSIGNMLEEVLYQEGAGFRACSRTEASSLSGGEQTDLILLDLIILPRLARGEVLPR